jgi:hypothetical protein
MESMRQTTASTNGWASRALSLLQRGLWVVAGRGWLWNGPLRQPDRRFHHRLNMYFEAKISRKSGWMRVRGVNMHAEGAMLMASRPLTPHSVVFVRVNTFKLVGFAQVRHCTEWGLWSYAIGVAFRAPLMREEFGTWQFHQIYLTDGKTPRGPEIAGPAAGV